MSLLKALSLWNYMMATGKVIVGVPAGLDTKEPLIARTWINVSPDLTNEELNRVETECRRLGAHDAATASIISSLSSISGWSRFEARNSAKIGKISKNAAIGDPDAIAESWIAASTTSSSEPIKVPTGIGGGGGFRRLLRADPELYGRTMFELERAFSLTVRKYVTSAERELDEIKAKRDRAVVSLSGSGKKRVRQSDIDYLNQKYEASVKRMGKKWAEKIENMHRKQLTEFRTFLRVTAASLDDQKSLNRAQNRHKTDLRTDKNDKGRVKTKSKNTLVNMTLMPSISETAEMWVGQCRRRRFRVHLCEMTFQDLVKRFQTQPQQDSKNMKKGSESDSEVMIYTQHGLELYGERLQGLICPTDMKVLLQGPTSVYDMLTRNRRVATGPSLGSDRSLRSDLPLGSDHSMGSDSLGSEKGYWEQLLETTIESPDRLLDSFHSQVLSLRSHLNPKPPPKTPTPYSRSLKSLISAMMRTRPSRKRIIKDGGKGKSGERTKRAIMVTRHSNLRLAHVVIHLGANDFKAGGAVEDIKTVFNAADEMGLGSLIFPLGSQAWGDKVSVQQVMRKACAALRELGAPAGTQACSLSDIIFVLSPETKGRTESLESMEPNNSPPPGLNESPREGDEKSQKKSLSEARHSDQIRRAFHSVFT